MHLNRLDLHVADVAATRDFLVHYFGLRERATLGRDGLAILEDDAGLELVISHPVARFGGATPDTAGAYTYHIGFMQPDRVAVDRLYQALLASTAEVWGEPRNVRNRWLFYCIAPGKS